MAGYKEYLYFLLLAAKVEESGGREYSRNITKKKNVLVFTAKDVRAADLSVRARKVKYAAFYKLYKRVAFSYAATAFVVT